MNRQEAANALRAEAKNRLGALIIDQQQADRIIDCIIGAAMLEVTIMMSSVMAAVSTQEGAKNG